MPTISVTRLRVRSWRFMPFFAFYAVQTRQQSLRAPGNRGVNLMREPGNIFWTATAWDSEADMKAYMSSGAHGKAMPHLMHWCDEASVTRWTQDTTALPTWQEAHRRMQSHGRRSKLLHPSPAHERFEIPPPRT